MGNDCKINIREGTNGEKVFTFDYKECERWYIDEQHYFAEYKGELKKKKPLMLAEPDDDELFRSLCMDANEANGYGRTC